MLRPLRVLAGALALGLLLAPTGVAPNQPFAEFAHPHDGDTLAPGTNLHVTARALFADPPADARLLFSETSGQTWHDVPGFEVHGRSIGGTYVPTPQQGQSGVVKFQTFSTTDQWFNTQIEVFLS